jgi:hypothetical protein
MLVAACVTVIGGNWSWDQALRTFALVAIGLSVGEVSKEVMARRGLGAVARTFLGLLVGIGVTLGLLFLVRVF